MEALLASGAGGAAWMVQAAPAVTGPGGMVQALAVEVGEVPEEPVGPGDRVVQTLLRGLGAGEDVLQLLLDDVPNLDEVAQAEPPGVGGGGRVGQLAPGRPLVGVGLEMALPFQELVGRVADGDVARLDRKSTRLNSSHVKISYAV